MKTLTYIPKGVCARKITVSIDDDGTIADVKFVGGCDGNHNGIVRLVKGMDAEAVIRALKGTPCRWHSTSCPDQLAKALESAL